MPIQCNINKMFCVPTCIISHIKGWSIPEAGLFKESCLLCNPTHPFCKIFQIKFIRHTFSQFHMTVTIYYFYRSIYYIDIWLFSK